MSEANRVRIAYRAAGSTDPFKIVRFTTDSLNDTPTTKTSEEINDDRQLTDVDVVAREVAGSIDFEFSATTFDDFLEAAMCSTFDEITGELVVGTQDIRFDVLKSYMDENIHVLFQNMHVNSFSLDIPSNDFVTGSVGFLGTGANNAYDPSADTFVDKSTTAVINSARDVGSIEFDGAPLSQTVVEALSIELGNNYSGQPGIGSLYPLKQSKGSNSVTGSTTVTFGTESFVFYKNAASKQDVALSYTISDGSTSYDVVLPRVRMSGELPSGAKDDTINLELEITGLKDTVVGSTMKITRTTL